MNTKSKLTSILVIDDEPGILIFLKLCLSRKGYRVDTAGNSEEGINKIKANDYDLIITDIKMKSLSGNRVLLYLRNVLKISVPVIAMSGTPRLMDREIFDAVLHKPCSVKEIYYVLNQVLNSPENGGMR